MHKWLVAGLSKLVTCLQSNFIGTNFRGLFSSPFVSYWVHINWLAPGYRMGVGNLTILGEAKTWVQASCHGINPGSLTPWTQKSVFSSIFAMMPRFIWFQFDFSNWFSDGSSLYRQDLAHYSLCLLLKSVCSFHAWPGQWRGKWTQSMHMLDRNVEERKGIVSWMTKQLRNGEELWNKRILFSLFFLFFNVNSFIISFYDFNSIRTSSKNNTHCISSVHILN